uniref:Uncharacterized protein n=1 Tax=Arundo donax TaxID=35708 RepID=A0A0A8ZKD5_ARUDO
MHIDHHVSQDNVTSRSNLTNKSDLHSIVLKLRRSSIMQNRGS